MSNKTNLPSMDGFTPKEKRIAMLLIHGKSRREAAEILGVSENTVKTHTQKIFRKSKVRSQREFMAMYLCCPDDADDEGIDH